MKVKRYCHFGSRNKRNLSYTEVNIVVKCSLLIQDYIAFCMSNRHSTSRSSPTESDSSITLFIYYICILCIYILYIHRYMLFPPKPVILFQMPDFKLFFYNACLLEKNLKCRLRYISSLYRTYRQLVASEGWTWKSA